VCAITQNAIFAYAKFSKPEMDSYIRKNLNPFLKLFLEFWSIKMKLTEAKSEQSSYKTQDATSLLKADHKLVEALFVEYKGTNSTAKKKLIVAQLCKELTIHAQIEEEIFYPAVQQALKDHELVPEAIVEHQTLKDLIAEVEGVEPDGDMYDAKIQVLSEYVKHHVKEEESEMFPEAKGTKLNLGELGVLMTERKEELSSQYAQK